MIEELSIKNFKSIQDATIRLRNVNILIGANNSGKSNLLDALVFYQRMLVMELSEVFGPGPFSFHNTFFRGSNIRLDYIGFEVKYGTNGQIIHKFKLEDYLNKGPYGPRFLLRLRDESIIVDSIEEKRENQSDLLLRTRWKHGDINSDNLIEFVKSCRSMRKFQFIPKEIKRERTIDPLDDSVPFLQFDGNNLVNVLFNLRDRQPEAFREIIDDFRAIFPEVSGLSFKHLGESKYGLEFSRQIGGRTWRFIGPEISDGFAITLAICTLIHNPFSPRIILIEEIENGLNPSTLRAILENIIISSERKEIQFLVTTHSPILLELLSSNPEYIIVCEQEAGNSKYTPLQDILLKFGPDYKHGESLFHLWFDGLIGGL